MKHADDIEKLFENTFKNFESDVSPNTWSMIQSRIPSASPSTSSSTHINFSIGKTILGITSAAIITGGIWYFTLFDKSVKIDPAKPLIQTEKTIPLKEETHNQKNTTKSVPVAGTVYQKKINSSPYYQTPPATRTLNHYLYDTPKYGQNSTVPLSANTTHNDSSSVSKKITPSQTTSNKYRNASNGTTSLMRGNRNQYMSANRKKNIGANEDAIAAIPPVANIHASTETGDVPLHVLFYNQGLATSLTWDFGDGTTSEENSPSHTYRKPGNYTVRLTAKNNSGSNTEKINIEVKSISGIEHTPNIFSPNGDGENDLFFLKLKNIASIEVIISDLNGHIIGGWNSNDGSWNGKLKNGENAPQGLYFYTIQAMGTDDVMHTQKGSISLSR